MTGFSGGSRRGFTLAEMLVVIALFALILSIVVPFTVSQLHRTSLVEGQQRLEAVMMLARADALRRGVAVRVVARGGGEAGVDLCGQDVVEKTDLRAVLGELHGGSEWASSDKSDLVPRESKLRDSPGGPLATLPPGLRILVTLKPERESDSTSAADGGSAAGKPSGSVDEVVIGVALPDGQFESAGARYLVGRTGDAAKIEVNRWTGAVTVTPVSAKDEEEKTDEGPEGDKPPAADAPGGNR